VWGSKGRMESRLTHHGVFACASLNALSIVLISLGESFPRVQAGRLCCLSVDWACSDACQRLHHKPTCEICRCTCKSSNNPNSLPPTHSIVCIFRAPAQDIHMLMSLCLPAVPPPSPQTSLRSASAPASQAPPTPPRIPNTNTHAQPTCPHRHVRLCVPFAPPPLAHRHH
jgi:hypothetical protein